MPAFSCRWANAAAVVTSAVAAGWATGWVAVHIASAEHPKWLLARVEEQAREAGVQALHLMVRPENKTALTLNGQAGDDVINLNADLTEGSRPLSPIELERRYDISVGKAGNDTPPVRARCNARRANVAGSRAAEAGRRRNRRRRCQLPLDPSLAQAPRLLALRCAQTRLRAV